mmetsp:Transcript_12397/g.16277  ORF Transcript_12397/g.16277 Transcript_12397/m.16277 type:complete len:163 (+) Transcript_12397:323-811(+)|eukprot:CAMPEP_0198140886 /NCGR_PEP_ID=MMETSP1443-20131203/3976_1 /TAXON_ID=186043 /ORGANISM="Entomoneis sp., Strain CCMP2396" /LENGTH=162 /DNA_ID=CAMNT_0043803451 /DNA_START=291 /DNA_END=779 /DNA_ORIENTATION=+
MTIYKDGKEQEQVHLHKIDNKEKLHALFREKGFIQMGPEEVKEVKAQRLMKTQEAESAQNKKYGLRKSSIRGQTEVAKSLERIRDMKGINGALASTKKLIAENDGRIQAKRETLEKKQDSTQVEITGDWNGTLLFGLMASVVVIVIIVASRKGIRKKITGKR